MCVLQHESPLHAGMQVAMWHSMHAAEQRCTPSRKGLQAARFLSQQLAPADSLVTSRTNLLSVGLFADVGDLPMQHTHF